MPAPGRFDRFDDDRGDAAQQAADDPRQPEQSTWTSIKPEEHRQTDNRGDHHDRAANRAIDHVIRVIQALRLTVLPLRGLVVFGKIETAEVHASIHDGRRTTGHQQQEHANRPSIIHMQILIGEDQ